MAVLGIALQVACADVGDRLAERLQHLPTVMGENRIITWPRNVSLVEIGIEHHVGYEHLRRANQGKLIPGRELLIPGRHMPAALLEDGLVLNQPELMLYRWEDGKVVAAYPVSIGMVDPQWHTPLGALTVADRLVDPYWYRDNGTMVPAGTSNPLGTRWVGLSRPGYGIHGTNDQTSIGRTVSHGCIRLFPAHIFDLFPHTWVGMPVVITYQTIMVGEKHGIVYLSVFPDVYSHGANTVAKAKARLMEYGLDGLYTEAELAARLRKQDGLAQPVLGSKIPVTVNGTPATPVIGPTQRNGIHYLAAIDFARMVNAKAVWNADTESVTFIRGERTVALSATTNAGFVTLDTAFLPVRAMAESLNGSVEVSDQGLKIRVP